MPPPGMTDYTWAFGENGFIFNSDSLGLPFIDVSQVTGLDDAPLRTSTNERSQMDGTYVDTPYMSMRTVVITGTLYSDPANPELLLDQLRQAYNQNTVQPFYFQHPGQGLRFVMGQGGGFQYAIDTGRRLGVTNIQATILCGNPYIYDYPSQAQVTTLGSSAGIGTGFNMAFNVGFGGAITGEGATVTNNGTHTAYPVIQLKGPLTNPVLTDGNGISMAFAISLTASDQLVVDCKNKSVVLNRQVSRRNTLAGLNWFSLPSGTSDTIFLSADSGTGTATVTLNDTYY